MASAPGVFNVQEFTDGGLPLVGGRVYTFVHGTAAFKTAYTDANGLIPHAYTSDGQGGQYIALNARGELPAPLYLVMGSYDVALKRADGSTVWTRRSEPVADYAAAETDNLRDELASSATLGTGSGMVGYNPTRAYPAGTVGNKLKQLTVSVADYGAIGNGVADDTASIQAAIDAVGPNGLVYIPRGEYKVTDTLRVRNLRVHVRGDGSWATRILFQPTSSKTCFLFQATSGVLYQGSVQGLSFYSTDLLYSKVAIEIVDQGGYLVTDIVIGGSIQAVPGSYFWSGGAFSTGILLRGRESINLSRLYIYADKPIVIMENPNHSISIDHYHFEDTYLAASNFPCVTITTGVNLTNVTFDGYNAWLLGTDGLKWIDTTSAGVSQTLVLRGIRWEQGLTTGGWCVDIQANVDMQSVTIEDCQGGVERNGYRFRKVSYVNIRNNINTGAAGRVVLDVDATVRGITLTECLWQAGGTASMVGQTVVSASPQPIGNAPLPPNAQYQTANSTETRVMSDCATGGRMVTVANGADVLIGGGETAGMLTVVDSEGIPATYALRGTNHAVQKLLDPASGYSAVAGTAATTNVYYDPLLLSYRLQNMRGGSRKYLVTLTGSFLSF